MSENLIFNATTFNAKLPEIQRLARESGSLESFRGKLLALCDKLEHEAMPVQEGDNIRSHIRVRDCARNLRVILAPRSEGLSNFSFIKAVYDCCLGEDRPDLGAEFYADTQHIFMGLLRRGNWESLTDVYLASTDLEGREAARARSRQMDDLYEAIETRMYSYAHGMSGESIARRQARVAAICRQLGATPEEFQQWQWQFNNIQSDVEKISDLVALREEEQQAISEARAQRLPFGMTPYYLSLMDDDPECGRDRAIRAQVLPPPGYVARMGTTEYDLADCDFMLEHDTSPINLITRRYPSICILKPYNTCPQICVYCQRNWEIDDVMEPDALAPPAQIEAALQWIRAHPAIHEVLVTGGDPLGLDDERLCEILDGIASIPTIERIRIGTRTLVTAPMRITERLAKALAGYREFGKRQVAVVTHVEHPYEVTPEMAMAVERLRCRGISVYNQQVYTFFVSRRFESLLLRRLLSRIGIQPYYTFNTKGKEETREYRVPLARLLQENKEEARLLPGLSRSDEGVYNVPGQGKNYLRAAQHRALISILPNGNRLYEFHPWEKNITRLTKGYIGEDVPLLRYLRELSKIGENHADYDTIWYYY